MGGGVCGLANLGGGRGLEVQEIREEGGVKNSCHPSGGGVDFFWNNPIQVHDCIFLQLRNYQGTTLEKNWFEE